MDIIRMYNKDTDIQPSLVLHKILRYLGFYIDEINDSSHENKIESIADIYIISNEFMSERADKDFIMDEDKAILVLTDDWSVNNGMIRSVRYSGSSKDRFIIRFLYELTEILEIYDGKGLSLLKSSRNWQEEIMFIAEACIDCGMMQASLFTRCFHGYRQFISKLKGYAEQHSNAHIIHYAILYAAYEENLICKNNNFENHYDTEYMIQKCNELLKEYSTNEELQLLRADIMFELNDKWLLACDMYADVTVQNCAYANYKRGKIFRTYLEEYDSAEIVLKWAISTNKLYYKAWYQLGKNYEIQGDYFEAIEAFEEIYNVLKQKYKQQLLSPVEMEYLYKAVMKIAAIYKTRITDYTSASIYNELAMKIYDARAMDKYIEAVLDRASDINGLVESIYKGTKKHMNIKLENIY